MDFNRKIWRGLGIKGEVDFLLLMHFPGKKYCCGSCEDLRMGVCAGDGLETYEAVRKCMEGKKGEVVCSPGVGDRKFNS